MNLQYKALEKLFSGFYLYVRLKNEHRINKRLSLDNEIAKNILVIGVFHGDEEQGEALVNRYLGRCGGGICPVCGFKYKMDEFCREISFDKSCRENDLKNNLYYIPRLNSAKTQR